MFRDVTVAGISFLAGAISVGLVLYLGFGPTYTRPESPSGDGPGAPVLRGEVARLQAENAALRRAGGLLRERAAPQDAAAGTPPGKGAASKRAESWTVAALFTNPEYRELLEGIDWRTVGDASARMQPLLNEILEHYLAGKEVSLELRLEIREWNEKILAEALKAKKGEVPGYGVNGTFTHPLLAANHLRGTLAALGVDLDRGQAAALEEIVRIYTAKDADLRIGAPEATVQLENLVREWRLRENFFREVHGLLTPEQETGVHQDKCRGRVGLDFFDASMAMVEFAVPLAVKAPEDLTLELGSYIKRHSSLEVGQIEQVNRIIKEWVAELPPSFWKRKPGKVDSRFLRGDRVLQAARRQAELFRRIMEQVGPDPAAVEKVTKGLRVFVPLPR